MYWWNYRIDFWWKCFKAHVMDRLYMPHLVNWWTYSQWNNYRYNDNGMMHWEYIVCVCLCSRVWRRNHKVAAQSVASWSQMPWCHLTSRYLQDYLRQWWPSSGLHLWKYLVAQSDFVINDITNWKLINSRFSFWTNNYHNSLLLNIVLMVHVYKLTGVIVLLPTAFCNKNVAPWQLRL